VRQQSLWLLAVCAFFFTGSVAQQRPASKPSSACGPLNAQSFKCPKFGFTYQVPFGWVDRTEDMQKESQPDDQGHAESGEQAKSETGKPTTENSGQSEVLLAAFERPPNAPGQTINSTVIIASESQSANPAIKTAADYFWSIADLAEQHGLKAENEPYEFAVGTKRLVRGDFQREVGKLTMWQSSLVMIEKGHFVWFTFIGGSEDEVEDLIGNLSFATGVRPPK
jgi:hypothetical protein